MSGDELTLVEQLRQTLRRLPGFVLGAPTRWVLDIHRPKDLGAGVAMCTSTSHRPPVEWPCRDWMDADGAMWEHPEWTR